MGIRPRDQYRSPEKCEGAGGGLRLAMRKMSAAYTGSFSHQGGGLDSL